MPEGKRFFFQLAPSLSFSSGKRIAIVGQNNIPSLKKKDVQEEVDKGNPNYIPIIGLMGRLWIIKQLFVSGVEYPPLAGLRKNVTPSDDHDFAMYILKVTYDWKKIILPVPSETSKVFRRNSTDMPANPGVKLNISKQPVRKAL